MYWPKQWVLQDVYRIDETEPVTLLIDNGRITAVDNTLALRSACRGWPVLDMQGRVILPGLIDAHQHLDKTHLYPDKTGDAATLKKAVVAAYRHHAITNVDEIVGRARQGVMLSLSAGTTALRSHADLGGAAGLKSVEALLRLRDEFQGRVTLQVSILPTVQPDGRLPEEEIAEAIRMGVDVVGGSSLRASPDQRRGLVERLFRIADAAGLPLDLHVDESDNPEDFTLPLIAQLTRSLGMGGKVTASHCCSLAAVSGEAAVETIAAVEASGVHVITLPWVNLHIQGRGDSQPVRRGITRVRQLLDAGVNVAAASDNIRDPFFPFGDGDLLRLAAFTCSAAHLGGKTGMSAAMRMVTEAPARILGCSANMGVSEKSRADLVILDWQGPAGPEWILSRLPSRYLVLYDGTPPFQPPNNLPPWRSVPRIVPEGGHASPPYRPPWAVRYFDAP